MHVNITPKKKINYKHSEAKPLSKAPGYVRFWRKKEESINWRWLVWLLERLVLWIVHTEVAPDRHGAPRNWMVWGSPSPNYRLCDYAWILDIRGYLAKWVFFCPLPYFAISKPTKPIPTWQYTTYMVLALTHHQSLWYQDVLTAWLCDWVMTSGC